jgi:hypothetical protein
MTPENKGLTMMKTVCLPEATWRSICALVEVSPVEEDHRFAGMILEQLSGAVKVRATRGGMGVTLKAPKGGDLRGVIETLSGK